MVNKTRLQIKEIIFFRTYFIFSSSLEHTSQTVSSSFDVNNLPHDEHLIVRFSYIYLYSYNKLLKQLPSDHWFRFIFYRLLDLQNILLHCCARPNSTLLPWLTILLNLIWHTLKDKQLLLFDHFKLIKTSSMIKSRASFLSHISPLPLIYLL